MSRQWLQFILVALTLFIYLTAEDAKMNYEEGSFHFYLLHSQLVLYCGAAGEIRVRCVWVYLTMAWQLGVMVYYSVPDHSIHTDNACFKESV